MNTSAHLYKKFNLPGNATGLIEIPNMDRRDLASLFRELGFTKGAEIGVERAVYSKSLCMRNPDAQIFFVDPWQAYRGYREHVSQEKLDGFFAESTERLSHFPKAVIIRKYSVDAAKDFKDGELDFVYLDGNHAYEHVVADLAAWAPKVRSGGLVCGHDYIKRVNPEYRMGVVPAVHGWIDAYRIDPLFIAGSKEEVPGQKRDKQRSWFFIKP